MSTIPSPWLAALTITFVFCVVPAPFLDRCTYQYNSLRYSPRLAEIESDTFAELIAQEI